MYGERSLLTTIGSLALNEEQSHHDRVDASAIN